MKSKRNEGLAIIAVTVLLSGCATLGGASDEESISNQVSVETSSGKVVSVVINSDDFVQLETDVAAEKTREECFKANGAMPTDSHAQVAREMRLAMGAKVDCGAGKFDVAVAEEQGKTERTKARWGTGERILGKGLIGAGVYGGLKVLGDIVETATENAGTKVTLNGESTLEGTVGEGNIVGDSNTHTRNDSDGDSNNTEIVEEEDDGDVGETPVVDFASCIAAGGDPVNTLSAVMALATDGIYDRCSDGSGGTITSF